MITEMDYRLIITRGICEFVIRIKIDDEDLHVACFGDNVLEAFRGAIKKTFLPIESIDFVSVDDFTNNVISNEDLAKKINSRLSLLGVVV